MWKGVNLIIQTKSKSNSSINCLEKNVDNELINVTDPHEISNLANNYFTNIAKNILEKRQYNGNKHFKQYLNSPNPHKFAFTPTSAHEVNEIINSIDTTKAVGPNSIPPKVLKLIAPIISNILANIFNESLTSGIFPKALKVSTINPIHKKDSKLLISNYRPISLLSNLNKIFEKIVHKQLYSFLEKHECIYNLQFGFRQKHSTNHALISIMNKIQEAIKTNDFAIGIFVDLQKAFDTVNHDILIEKLDYYGISGITNSWFKSYLTERKQQVKINGITSSQTETLHGVPQGSILGPLLFLIYINDLHKCINNSLTFHFADDTNLLYTPSRKLRNRNITRRLNIDLKLLNNWLIANKISLNSTKTEMIVFRKKTTPLPKMVVKLNGVKLTPKSTTNYLGLTMDEHLTFKQHLQILNAKLKRCNSLLALSRHYVPVEILKQIYYTQFNSNIIYGCQIWGHATDISKTSTLQKKAIRIMSFSPPETHSSPLFKEFSILKIDDLIKLNNTLFVHSTLNNHSPKYFDDFFTLYMPCHDYLTRNIPNSPFTLPPGSVSLSNMDKRSIRYKCANNWNDNLKELSYLPGDSIKILNSSFLTLKKSLKQLFLQNY